MAKNYLVDTDVLVDYLRGEEKAVNYIKKHAKKITLSAVSAAELYAGVREGREQQQLDEFIGLFPILPVNLETAQIGGIYKRDFFKSHHLSLADAIIAATAETHEADLTTLNTKHFPMLKGLKPPYKKE